MGSNIESILGLEVPLIVVLGERRMRVSEVMSLVAGAIIELPKVADEELELLVNNKAIGTGMAVKVGENFGLRITFMGDLKERIQALGAKQSNTAEEGAAPAPAVTVAEAAGA
jgi:flagellar motor switch protein FliN/FliY